MKSRENISPETIGDFAASQSVKIPLETKLNIDGLYDDVQAWRTLSRYIVRYPQDLRCHAQRVLLANLMLSGEYLPGALLDLHIATQGKGRRYKLNLLEHVKPGLPAEEYSYFRLRFDSTAFSSTAFSSTQFDWKNGSVLANGVEDTRSLVNVQVVEVTGFGGVLEEARSCIEYGQLDAAQNLLEEELLRTPGAVDVEEELLNLYHYTRDRTAIERMTNELLKLDVELSGSWKACQIEAESWD